MFTAAASCTETSVRPTSCSVRRATASTSSTSARPSVHWSRWSRRPGRTAASFSWLCCHTHTHTHTHTHAYTFNGPFSGTPRVSLYQKSEPVWILLKQETVSGSGISCWAILCKSAPRSRQITMPAPNHSLQAGCPSCGPTNSVKPLKYVLSRRLKQSVLLVGSRMKYIRE